MFPCPRDETGHIRLRVRRFGYRDIGRREEGTQCRATTADALVDLDRTAMRFYDAEYRRESEARPALAAVRSSS